MLLLLPFLASSGDIESILTELHLPTSSDGWIPLNSPDSELNESLIRRAAETFRYPLNPNSQLIISMRWTTLEDQLSHFIFGAALAFALNRSIRVEMRRYPLAGPQPDFFFALRGISMGLIDPPVFSRLRIARELYCKSQTDLETDLPSIPILVRNFDDISALYGNHFVGRRLRELFGFHAAFFIANRFVALPERSRKGTVGVEVKSFVRSRRMKHLRDVDLIVANFTMAIGKIVDPAKERIVVVSNDTKIADRLKKSWPNVEVMAEDARGLAELIGAREFIGTYRSKLATHVSTLRGRKGWLVNTDTGDLMEMGNSQAGILSPYIQDVEDVEFTVNERLRGCADNIDDLRDVLRTFVL
jgi:hypothetical protein